jgi:hypothetical protein
VYFAEYVERGRGDLLEKCTGICGIDPCKYWMCRLENPVVRKYFRERDFIKRNLEELAKRAELKANGRKPIDAATIEQEKEITDVDGEDEEEIEE